MPINLNYEAQASALIDPRVPFSVQVKSDSKGPLPPGDRRWKDYIPKETKALTKASDEVHRKNFMRAPVFRDVGQDYVSPEASEKRRIADKARILEIAKEIYANDKNRRILYKDAEKVLAADDLDESSQTVIRARKIISRGAPLTKEEAVSKAARQFYGHRS